MDCPPLHVNIGLNEIRYTTALIDTGCLTYGLINEAFAKKLYLPRIKIQPRTLIQRNVITPDAIQ
jgi:predicted aspartyl protease